MSSGFKSGTVDLDDVFDPYQAGSKPAATGFQAGSQDLKDRYNPISEGEAAAATGFKVGTTDLNQIFAAKGSSTQALVIPFGSYSASSSGSHDAGASFGLSINADGTWAVGLSALQGSTAGTPLTGTWHRSPAAGVGASYEVRFTAHVTASHTGDVLDGTYSPSSGWLPLSSDQGVNAYTDHISSGGSSNTGSSDVSGYYTVEIRKIGAAAVRASECHFSISAFSV